MDMDGSVYLYERFDPSLLFYKKFLPSRFKSIVVPFNSSSTIYCHLFYVPSHENITISSRYAHTPLYFLHVAENLVLNCFHCNDRYRKLDAFQCGMSHTS